MNSNIVLKTQQRFRSEGHNVFTEKDYDKVVCHDKYLYGTGPRGLRKSELIECTKINNVMINFGDVVGENKQEHNPDWPQIPDHPYRILIVGRSGSKKQ